MGISKRRTLLELGVEGVNVDLDQRLSTFGLLQNLAIIAADPHAYTGSYLGPHNMLQIPLAQHGHR